MLTMIDPEETIICVMCESECHINPINSDAADSKILFCPYCGEELVVDDEDDVDRWIESHNDDQWDEC
jgi:hypothetical protein